MKTKILVYADSPTVKTGFGTVTRNVMEILHNTGKYDIEIFGINYHGIPHNFPYAIWPAFGMAENDPYGRKKFCYHALNAKFDILWVLQDSFIIDFLPELVAHLKDQVVTGKRPPFKVVTYYPTDSIIKPAWYKNLCFSDYLVSYTKFGLEAAKIARDNLKGLLDQQTMQELVARGGKIDVIDAAEVIYHGVNTKDFYPLPEEEVQSFKRHYFRSLHDKFIIMNVSRNQQRKDIPRTVMAFKEFKRNRPDSILYLHMAAVDQGWNIPELCNSIGLEINKDVILPENFEPNQAYPVEVLNALYNSADLVVSTTTGEGFGLSWVEAMACNTPVLMPNNTAMKELITEDLGYLIDCGNNSSLWSCVPNDNDVYRPLVDVDDMVDKLAYIHDNYDEAKAKARKAYLWVLESLDWKKDIAKQWLRLFSNISQELKNAQNPNGKRETGGGLINTEII